MFSLLHLNSLFGQVSDKLYYLFSVPTKFKGRFYLNPDNAFLRIVFPYGTQINVLTS